MSFEQFQASFEKVKWWFAALVASTGVTVAGLNYFVTPTQAEGEHTRIIAEAAREREKLEGTTASTFAQILQLLEAERQSREAERQRILLQSLDNVDATIKHGQPGPEYRAVLEAQKIHIERELGAM